MTGDLSSTRQIEGQSFYIIAWLIKILVEGLPDANSRSVSLQTYRREFWIETFQDLHDTPMLKAIKTFFPNQYIAGDAISLAL